MQARLCDRCRAIMPKDYKPVIVTVTREHVAIRTTEYVSIGSYPQLLPAAGFDTYTSRKEFCAECSDEFKVLYGNWLGEADDVRQIV